MPILLTAVIVIWLVQTTESLLAQPMKVLLPEAMHFPGMGIAIALAAIYLVGLAIHGRALRAIFSWLQDLLQRLPVINVVYNNLNEMIEFISGEKDGDLERVVLVDLLDGVRLMGFVTQDQSDLSSDDEEPLHAVYLPMSYQMGGYLVYVNDSKLTNLNISKKEAMQRILTADISSNESSLPLEGSHVAK